MIIKPSARPFMSPTTHFGLDLSCYQEPPGPDGPEHLVVETPSGFQPFLVESQPDGSTKIIGQPVNLINLHREMLLKLYKKDGIPDCLDCLKEIDASAWMSAVMVAGDELWGHSLHHAFSKSKSLPDFGGGE